jgi:hypothetical protein
MTEKIWEWQEFEVLPKKEKTGCFRFINKCYHFKNGQLHSLNQPAVEYDGYKAWYKEGERHRLDGPAIERFSGEEWWRDGKKHRLGGPAVEDHVNVYKEWWNDGERHRLDGPAVEEFDRTYWFIEGKEYTEEEFKKVSFAILNNLEKFL